MTMTCMFDSAAATVVSGTIVVEDETQHPSDEAAETISDGSIERIAPPPAFGTAVDRRSLLAPRFRWPRLARASVAAPLPRLPRPNRRA